VESIYTTIIPLAATFMYNEAKIEGGEKK